MSLVLNMLSVTDEERKKKPNTLLKDLPMYSSDYSGKFFMGYL